MRNYNYAHKWQALLTPEIVALLTQIHEYKGVQNQFAETQADTLTQLVEIAKIQSTEASNKIEGIFTSEERLKKLVLDKTTPKSRDEQEIAGYRDVLSTIHESHDFIPPKPSIMLQLHRDLYKFSGLGFGGNYKTSNNVIAEEDAKGNKFVRFQPVEAWETSAAIEELCKSYEQIIGEGIANPLIIIPMFILDFLCIHPFNDGNGRMSRLLTLLLLYRQGYHVGKYISLEKLIEQSKETYYEVLRESSQNWHEETNNYEPFVKYTLGIILAAYRDFDQRTMSILAKGVSKPDRVREVIKNKLGKITKREIVEQCPDIAEITIMRTLAELQQNGEIKKLGGGRYTSYVWNGERE